MQTLPTLYTRESLRENDGGTYLVREDFGPIKIGRSVRISKRVADLRAVGHRLRLLAFTACRSDERTLHHAFADHRVHGEWFAPCADLLAYLKTATPQPPPTTPAAPVPAVAVLRRIVNARTQLWVAQELGVTQQAVSQWLRRASRPLPTFRSAMWRKLDIPEEDWLTAAELAELRKGPA